MKAPSIEMKWLRGKSWEMVDSVPKPIVWCFVDACHCESCVTKEIKTFAPVILPGGWLIFHDVGDTYPKMAPSEWYHGKKHDMSTKRHVGVLEAIAATEERYLSDYELVEEAPCKSILRPSQKAWFGGMRVYQRREA